MPRRELNLSGYRAMWLMAMFDLPVKTRRERREYARFRNVLLDNGFWQMQFSVYARFCASEDIAATHSRRVREALPPDGHIRLVAITDRQFAKMQVFHGKKPAKPEKSPSQLALF